MGDSEVNGTRLSISGLVFAGRGRVRAISWVAGAGAGLITLRSGGASGTVRLIVDTATGVNASQYLKLPGRGVRFDQDIYCALAGVGFVTVFYEGG